MPSAAYFSLPVYGHVNPSLPLVKALTESGTDVTYYGDPRFRDEIVATGASFAPYPDAMSFAESGPNGNTGGRFLYGVVHAVDLMLGRPLEQLRARPPDFVVHDVMAPWGKIFAEAMGVPAVAMAPLFVHNADTAAWMRRVPDPSLLEGPAVRASSSRDTARALGLARGLRRRISNEVGAQVDLLRDYVRPYEGLNVVATSRMFQPCGSSFDQRFQFVGALLGDPPQGDDDSRSAAGDRPLVYVSMGTSGLVRNADFFELFFEVLRDFEGDAIVSTGGGFAPEELGAAPENVEVRRFIPQSEELDIIRRSRAVVMQGGFSTLHKCLFFETPVVAIPLMGEQARNACRVDELRAGVWIQHSMRTPRMLRAAIHSVCTREHFRDNARRLSQSLRESGGAARAAGLIHDYVASVA